MPIRNTSTEREPLKYCTDFLISFEDTQAWDHSTSTLSQSHPLAPYAAVLPRGQRSLKIPSFQRGIEWNFDLLERCINSRSRILGITVIGAHLGQPNHEFMLDGLQRYSAFLSLFFNLRSVLFDPIVPAEVHPAVQGSPGFINLRRSMSFHSSLKPLVEYNYHAMQYHTRMLVAKSFSEWDSVELQPNLDRLINHQNADFKLDESIAFFAALSDFVIKPVYCQDISGFGNYGELIYTFSGLNTVRMELGAADICRSILVDGLAACSSPAATPQQILGIESEFNSAFLTPTGRIKRGFQPFISCLEENWKSSNGSHGRRLLPALFQAHQQPGNCQAIIAEFGALTQWVEDFYVHAESNSYLGFIKTLGDNPFVATMMYFMGKVQQPSAILDSDLHKIAVAYLRMYLRNNVGSSLPITIKCASGDFQALGDFIQAVNANACPAAVGSPVPRPWIEAALGAIKGTKRTQVIFAACLLPPVRSGAAWGASFQTMQFGAGGSNWTVDHMIPDANFGQTPPTLGDSFKDSLRNFYPIHGVDNSSYRRTPCATKLDAASTYYSTYISNPSKLTGGAAHPFINQVFNLQAQAGGLAGLDNKDYLVVQDPSTSRCYGGERFSILCDIFERLL